MRFADQVTLLTGASSGIGWELAQEMARQGSRMGLMARRQDKLEELRERIRSQGGVAEVAAVDVTDRQAVHAAVAELRAKLGPIDRMIANAGLGNFSRLHPSNVPTQENLLRVNVFGMIYSFEAVVPEMLERHRGHLVGISSLASYKGLPRQSAYCASKAAVNAYLEGLRIEYLLQGIDVTTVCPGFITTPMTAHNPPNMMFLMSAEKAAQKIAGALYRRKKVFNFPWQTRFLLWLSKWAPDRLMVRAMGDYSEEHVDKHV